MHTQLAAVKNFHDKMSVSAETTYRGHVDLERVGQLLLLHSKYLEERVSEPEFLRAHLMLEELGEYLVANNEVQALDALTDLLYVLLGTAVTWNWPLVQAFAEVHKSNMSKVPQDDDPSRERVRKKGPNFAKPDLAKVLADPQDTDPLEVVLSGYRKVLDLRDLTEEQQRTLYSLYLEMKQCTKQ